MKNSKLKYLFSILMIFVVAFSCTMLTACGKNDNNDNDSVNFGEKKTLVAYFSATGNTETIALYIKDKLGADTYEIVPTIAYSSADLNYNNSSSRVSLEHSARSSKDTSSEYYRPSFFKTLDNFDDYDVIFVGYPIWWGETPNIICSFLEEYADDFEGKTIIPFCTSASSGIGNSAKNMHDLVSEKATWLNGQRFSSNASRSSVNSWVDDISVK